MKAITETLGEDLLQLANDASLEGRMNDPTGAAFVKGKCGDEMEFYLFIRGGVIEDARYSTTGCEITRACAAFVAKTVLGAPVREAMGINPKQILDTFPDIPRDHQHCAILATLAFLQAAADYLLKP